MAVLGVVPILRLRVRVLVLLGTWALEVVIHLVQLDSDV
jgi:hypothetical protein